MKKLDLGIAKNKMMGLWRQHIVQRRFRIVLCVVLSLALFGLLIGLDFNIANHYRHPALLQQIFSGGGVYYDYVEVSGQAVYVKGEDTEIAGTLHCYKENVLVKEVPLTKKIDSHFGTGKVGEHEDQFEYNHISLRYSYRVVEPYDPADGVPVGYSMANVRTQYGLGDTFDMTGIITVSLDSGKQVTMPLRQSFVPDFDTSEIGEHQVNVVFEVGDVRFETILFYTVS